MGNFAYVASGKGRSWRVEVVVAGSLIRTEAMALLRYLLKERAINGRMVTLVGRKVKLLSAAVSRTRFGSDPPRSV